MASMLAEMLGESPAQSKARVEEASKNANDLSGLVRKKKPKVEPNAGAAASGTSTATNGKRKLDEADGVEAEGKKPKLEG